MNIELQKFASRENKKREKFNSRVRRIKQKVAWNKSRLISNSSDAF